MAFLPCGIDGEPEAGSRGAQSLGTAGWEELQSSLERWMIGRMSREDRIGT